MSDDQGNDDEYREQVARQLRTREAYLAGIEREIAEVEFRLRQCSPSRLVMAGDAPRVASAAAYRRKLGTQREKMLHDRLLAVEDVGRARERWQMLNDEDQERASSNEESE